MDRGVRQPCFCQQLRQKLYEPVEMFATGNRTSVAGILFACGSPLLFVLMTPCLPKILNGFRQPVLYNLFLFHFRFYFGVREQ